MNSDRLLKLIKIILIGSAAIALLLIWNLKHKTNKQPKTSPLPEVVIQLPKSMQITDYVTQTGTMVAYNSVDLVARIKGYLDAVEFTDGTMVKKGKELFVIEPEPYMEKLKEAQATVVVQTASYDYAKSEYERQQRMYKQNATSLNNVEKWSAKAIQTKAEIAKAVANAEIATINYSYTHVLAPFDGRIGRHLVDPGNLVGNGQATNLATIEQIDPIYVYFNLNELDLIKIRKSLRNNDFDPANLNQVPVYVSLQNEPNSLHEGKMNFVNTGLNASTGTMEFRALLTNKDYSLLPGLFVQVRIPVSKPSAQLTIPNAAVQYDQIGAYILILDKNNYVQVKRVVPGALENGARAIMKGLAEDDKVIVAGIQNATPNHQATPVQAESPK